MGRIRQAYCKASCSWLPGREEPYSAAITEGVKSIGQPFNGEWAARSLAPGGGPFRREGLCALKEEQRTAAVPCPISERDKLRPLQETEPAARVCLAPNTCPPCAPAHSTVNPPALPAPLGCTAFHRSAWKGSSWVASFTPHSKRTSLL